MAKKPTHKTGPNGEPGKKPKRRFGVNYNFWLASPISEAFQRWRESHEFLPDQTDAFERAMIHFLEGKGFWTPEDKAKLVLFEAERRAARRLRGRKPGTGT